MMVMHSFLAQRLYKVNILLIESNKPVVTLFEKILSHVGFIKISVATDSAQAIQLLRAHKFHLIIVDSKLPILNPEIRNKVIQLNGADFIKRLRRSENSPCPYIPVLTLADANQPEEMRELRDCGVNQVCMRPVSADDLFKKIIQIIDHPRIHIVSDHYVGPDRRHMSNRSVSPDRREHILNVAPFRLAA